MEKTKLGNMVVKELLETNNVQLSRFKQFRETTPSARRRLNRMQGGEISVPLPRTNDQLRDTLKVFSLTVCGIILNSKVIVKLCQGHSASYNVHLIERLSTHMRIWFESK